MQTSRVAHNVVDRAGQRYGRLVVVERVGTKRGFAAWLCQCDCGVKKVVGSDQLRGGTKSCGCARRTGPGSRPNYACRLPPGDAARNQVLKQYRGAARARGLAWDLTNDEFFALTKMACAYCGSPPTLIRKVSRNGSYTFNGIDRIDNRSGYTRGNVAACCARCNHAKRDMPVAEFRDWLACVAAHWLADQH